MRIRKFLLRLLTRQRSCGRSRQRHGRVASAPVNDVLRLQVLKATLLSPGRERR
jgi:hypothetical protein